MNTARIIAVTQPIRTEEFSLEPNMTAEDLIAY